MKKHVKFVLLLSVALLVMVVIVRPVVTYASPALSAPVSIMPLDFELLDERPSIRNY